MKKIFIIIPIILLSLVFVFSMPCDKELTCTGVATTYLSYPGLWFLILIPLSLLALTLSDQKHKFWLKFTGVFFVVAMLFVSLMPEYSGGFGVALGPDKESTNWFFVGLYLIVSIIYFLVQFLKKEA